MVHRLGLQAATQHRRHHRGEQQTWQQLLITAKPQGKKGGKQRQLSGTSQAGLAGATQLPLFSTLFALRLCGDQQLLPGLLLASVVAAMLSRSLQPQPVYHGLTALFAARLEGAAAVEEDENHSGTSQGDQR